MMLLGTQRVNGRGHLEIGGVDLAELAAEYGTPLYVMDEAAFRQKAREFLAAFRARYPRVEVSFAGKAFLCTGFCKLVEQEGLNLDVASGGELYTALRAGFPVERISVHGNRLSGGGDAPDGFDLKALRLALFGLNGRLPDVLWDGYANAALAGGPQICLRDVSGVVNADGPNGYKNPNADASPFGCSLPPLPAVLPAAPPEVPALPSVQAILPVAAPALAVELPVVSIPPVTLP